MLYRSQHLINPQVFSDTFITEELVIKQMVNEFLASLPKPVSLNDLTILKYGKNLITQKWGKYHYNVFDKSWTQVPCETYTELGWVTVLSNTCPELSLYVIFTNL